VAANYAMCGKAFDPRFILALAERQVCRDGRLAQASDVVYNILAKAAKDRREGGTRPAAPAVKENYVEQADIRYAAARGSVDAVIQPHETRAATLLRAFCGWRRDPPPKPSFHTGVIQV